MGADHGEESGCPSRGSGGRHALVYHAGGLGDFVLSLPAVFRVAGAHPRLLWRFWGPSERRALLPGFLAAPNELLRGGHTLWGGAPDTAALDRLGKMELVLAFGGRQPPPWASPAGPEGPDGGRRLGVSAFPPPGGAWVPAHQARQLDALELPPVRRPWLPAWRSCVLPAPSPSEILLHPGSGDPRKNLPEATWTEVLRELTRRTNLPGVLVLGPVEQERGGAGALGRAVEGVRTCSTLAELLAALSRARLFLGNDSGATHLAAALGIPTVAVFGPSDPRLWKPLGPRVRVVHAGRSCAPCSAGEPIGCREPACWEDLPARAIVAAAIDLLPSRG